MINSQRIGLVLLVTAVVVFSASLFLGKFMLPYEEFHAFKKEHGVKSQIFDAMVRSEIVGKEFDNPWSFAFAIQSCLDRANAFHTEKEEWGMKIYGEPEKIIDLERRAVSGIVAENKGLFLFLTFGLGILGGLFFILTALKLDGPPGIKNHHVYHRASTNRGWIAWLIFGWLIAFYILLYFYPQLVISWSLICDPAKAIFGTGVASQWFVYGLLYCTVMSVMGVRMIIKYRNVPYQVIRTCSVVFFQVVFAFLLVEILPIFKLPAVDFKNAWPLDYDFLFDWNVVSLLQTESYGKFGSFVLIWGAVFAMVVVPVMVVIFGKRWYCSWVCGCGGLAETLGDPYRQHSSKSLFSWRVERILIHAVLIFAVVMTGFVGVHSFNVVHSASPENAEYMFFDISTYDIRMIYGFLIGSIFSGVIGTGFYPIFGSRVWCRFGCPLAALMGIVQRYNSRFRITTNGSQCISCGNCSTYCEQGIDVRWYAQRGQDIVRASCVGCGVCSAVCPRGVLKLENQPMINRGINKPIMISNEGVKLYAYIDIDEY